MGDVSITLERAVATTAASEASTARRARAIVEEHIDFIWRSLRQLGVAEADVDDAVQQVFVVATQKLDRITPGAERSYVYSVALRVAARARRSRDRRREATDPGLLRHPDPAPDPEEVVARRQALALLDEILDEMPLALRAVFTLYELEEVNVPDIAAMLGIPVGTAASRLRRAREDFQARAREIERTSPVSKRYGACPGGMR
ncbi:MAG: sigma-70 family RNA polymerase sigma factor [Polyangiaceae bacterium]